MSVKTKGFGEAQTAEMLATAKGLLAQVEAEIVTNFREVASPIVSGTDLVDGTTWKPIKEQLAELFEMNSEVIGQIRAMIGYIEGVANDLGLALANAERDQQTALEDLKRLTSQAQAADPKAN